MSICASARMRSQLSFGMAIGDTGAPAVRKPTQADGVGDPRIRAQVRAEQVRTLYRQSVPVLLGNVLNATILAWLLWSEISHALLGGWVAAMTLMALVRFELRRRYWSRERHTREQELWGTRFTLGSLSAGALWGFAGFALMPDSLMLQTVIVFVLAGMAAGATLTLSCVMRAYCAYLVPSLLPACVRLFLFGGQEHFAMAAMLALFVGLLLLVARNIGRALNQAFRLRFENAELLSQVSVAQTSLVQANEKLQRSNEQLEQRVRQRTEELWASERRLYEIVNESPDAIVVFDESACLLAANPAAERIAGRPLQTMLGQHFADNDWLATSDVPRAAALFQAVLDGAGRPAEELHIVRADGQSAVIELSLRLVQGNDGRRRIHSVMRDVTERHRLQRLKEVFESRLREAERLEAVGMLAGGVAHDFNNVLTMILGNVDLLETWGGDPHAKALLGEIRHGSLQVANLTKQLLAFSRQQVLDIKPADLAHVMSSAAGLFERALGERNQLRVSLPDEPMVVLVDATQIEQAVLNLLVNARHAMPDGGTVELEVCRVQLQADPDWPDAEAGEYVRLRVADTGLGMDEATRSRVFEPFFTTKELGHGTGLGLSSVHGVVKQAGGHIRVDSQPGHGSRFEFVLPCHAAPAHVGRRDDPRVWSPGFGTVLVVEDQEQVRRSLTRLLQDAGYDVEAAENAEQAIGVARRRADRIDLLVTDVIMPGVSGIELSRRMRALYPNLAVLLVSGYAGGEINLHNELGDNVQFLQKPFDAVSLTSAARVVLLQARGALTRTASIPAD
jgi:PAS domain S-box-containing protein